MIGYAFIMFTRPLEHWLGIYNGEVLGQSPVSFMGLFLVGVVSIIILHEVLHGLMFWVYTKKVKFGVKLDKVFLVLPYATSPNGKLKKNQMLVTALAPQILSALLFAISILGNQPLIISRVLFWCGMMNLVGGVIDIYFSIWLLKFKENILVEDTIDGVIVYDTAL